MIKSAVKTVGVIGSGLGGLSAACVLAARGYKVVVFEKNPWIGGKAAELKEQGYRFDMGPTILTVPKVLTRIFEEAGRKLEDYLQLVRLDPQWRCFFDDGSTMDLVEDTNQMAAAIEKRRAGSGAGYKKFLSWAEELHDISERWFFWKSVGGIKDAIPPYAALKPSTLKDLLAIQMGKSVADSIRSYVPDERIAQMLDHYTQYVGSNPYNSPAVLCSIASLQSHEGVWYPVGGTRAVPLALEKLGRELGVAYRTETEVAQIVLEGGAVAGVVTHAGARVALDAVVSNMDAVRTLTDLVGGAHGAAMKKKDYEPACSGVVLYLGLKKAYDHLLHHNFVFSRDPKEEFDFIYHKGEPAPDPTCYLAATTRTEKETAPQGGEALYVLVHTPYLRPHHDWSKMLPGYRQVILEKLKRTAGLTDIEDRIAFEAHLTPQSIHDRYRVLNGAIYGVASHGTYMGAFKPANRRKNIRGLYLAGGAAHPGPGMPMVMMSGWIAADVLDQDNGT